MAVAAMGISQVIVTFNSMRAARLIPGSGDPHFQNNFGIMRLGVCAAHGHTLHRRNDMVGQMLHERATTLYAAVLRNRSRRLIKCAKDSGHYQNVWQFMRDNWLANRVFESYDDLVDHCCDAYNKLVDQPWRIMSIGLRHWTHGF